MQLSRRILEEVQKLAEVFVTFLIPFPLTTALIMRDEMKFDRIDTKLIKQAEKLNKKQKLSVKQQYREKQRVGAITYRSYSIQFKKDLIASIRQQVLAAERSKQRTITLSMIIRNKAKETKIHPKNITRWYQAKQLKKKQGGRRALYPEMQFRLANFIKSNPNIKRKHILKQAKQIMEDLKIPGREDFNFSKGWYERFRERLNKQKIPKGLKLEEIVKIEAKEEYDVVKKEQDQDYNLNEDYEEYDYSEDDDDNVKFEEVLQDEEGDQQFFNVKLDESEELTEAKSVARQELYFDSEQQVKQEEETSTDRIIKFEKEQILANNSKFTKS